MSNSLIMPGHNACPGCAGATAERLILEVLGKNTIWFGEGVCAGTSSRNNVLPTLDMHFSGCAGAGATGIVSALEVKGKDGITVVSAGGDGALGDIGLGKISACAQRNDNFIQLCFDNEAYMNTGIQGSSLTPNKAWTTTTTTGNPQKKKNLPLIMAYHYVPYVATASPAYFKDLQRKIEKAQQIEGYKFIQILCPCPTGWGFPSEKMIEIARLVVQTNMWPLYEIENGIVTINVKPRKKSVEEYLSLQRRFRDITEKDIEIIQNNVDKNWEKLLQLEKVGIL